MIEKLSKNPEHYVISKIKEQRQEQLVVEKQKKYFLEESKKLFKENGVEQKFLEYVESSRIQKWLRYSEDPIFEKITTSSGLIKEKKIGSHTLAQIRHSDKSIAISLIYDKHCKEQYILPSMNEIEVRQDEDGEFTVSGYNHEYTDDGYRKDTRFEERTSSEELKGQPLDVKFSMLINKAVIATSAPKNK